MTNTAIDSIKECQWCNCHHPNTFCPRAKAIEYYPDGTVKRVEFWESPKLTYNMVNIDELLKNNP